MSDLAAQFPDPALAATLLPHAFDAGDGAHDGAHLLRVWRNARAIAAEEGGDREILLAAVLLHDCVWIDKGSPDRARASRLAADKARGVLRGLDWDEARIARTCHAIEAHSHSAGIPPESPEARVLQDADRLDAMGFIGVARCLYTAGLRGAAIHHPTDPAAEARALDDKAHALDHFRTKLLHLDRTLTTAAGRRMAEARAARLRGWYEGILEEIGAPPGDDPA